MVRMRQRQDIARAGAGLESGASHELVMVSPDYEAIEGGQMRRPLRSLADQQLLFSAEEIRRRRCGPTGTEEHFATVTIRCYYEIATDTAQLTACWAGLTVADGKNGGSISYSP